MIIKRKLFAKRQYTQYIIDRTGLFHHYTIPKHIPSINKTGLTFRPHKGGLSVLEGKTDLLLGQNIAELQRGVNGRKVSTYIDNKKYDLDVLKNILSTKPTSELTLPEKHLLGDIDRSYLFYAAGFQGSGAAPNPVQQLSSIDGLRWQWDPNKAKFLQVTHRKTRNPIRILVKNQTTAGKGSDTGEFLLRPVGNVVLPKNLLYEIPQSGVGTRDTDIKHLRRYLKGHKGQVNATRETMEALYGKQWPHLDKFS